MTTAIKALEFDAFQDKKYASNWRVEAIDYDNEGDIYVAVFSGPEAKERAEEYARFKNGA